jgi:hypothetical protein
MCVLAATSATAGASVMEIQCRFRHGIFLLAELEDKIASTATGRGRRQLTQLYFLKEQGDYSFAPRHL